MPKVQNPRSKGIKIDGGRILYIILKPQITFLELWLSGGQRASNEISLLTT